MKNKRLIFFFLLWLVLLTLPLIMRQKGNSADKLIGSENEKEKLVIISAHNKAIKDEYSRAFKEYCLREYGREVEIDFRSPGGTSDIVRYIADRYEAEFRRFCEANGIGWTKETAAAFADPSVDNNKDASPEAVRARKLFLESDVSIGIDIFAGGGTFDQARHAARGFAVDAGVKERHPEYFRSDVIPPVFGGDKLYDPAGRYYGVVVSTFGILYNSERLDGMSEKTPPCRWSDLGDAKYFNTLAVADPSKSGSANKCFEIVIQQAMAEAADPSEGWQSGLNVIKKIFANARNISDSASKVVHDVGTGDAAAGMAIDTYGISEMFWSSYIFDGKARCVYVTPRGGTAVSSDPVQMLRGAPNRELAKIFIDFLLSEEGQKLHFYRTGIPGGPQKHSLNRPPIRVDMYTKEHLANSFMPEYNPYASGADFVYRPELTGRYYNLLRVLLKAIALDAHDELHYAWQKIIEAGGPEKVPEAMRCFNALPFEYDKADEARRSISVGKDRSAADVAGTVRSWSDFARRQYIQAAELAQTGK
jgi:ABC-type Fe3+ transport system substrate-binding protein